MAGFFETGGKVLGSEQSSLDIQMKNENRRKFKSKDSFARKAGAMMPLRRNMETFNGDKYRCTCGSRHIFNTRTSIVIAEGMNGKFIVVCPDDSNLMSLIQTKMKWGIVYQGLELLAGSEV